MGVVACSLADLGAEFVKLDSDGAGWRVDATFDDCDGVWFQCPKCFVANAHSAIGVHMVLCWKLNISQDRTPKPGRWGHEGTGIHDLSLVAGSSSIQIQGGCNAHFFVKHGNVEDLT